MRTLRRRVSLLGGIPAQKGVKGIFAVRARTPHAAPAPAATDAPQLDTI